MLNFTFIKRFTNYTTNFITFGYRYCLIIILNWKSRRGWNFNLFIMMYFTLMFEIFKGILFRQTINLRRHLLLGTYPGPNKLIVFVLRCQHDADVFCYLLEVTQGRWRLFIIFGLGAWSQIWIVSWSYFRCNTKPCIGCHYLVALTIYCELLVFCVWLVNWTLVCSSRIAIFSSDIISNGCVLTEILLW